MNNFTIIPLAFRVNPPNTGLAHVLSFFRPHPTPARKLKRNCPWSANLGDFWDFKQIFDKALYKFSVLKGFLMYISF
jgi:hypothetical protein